MPTTMNTNNNTPMQKNTKDIAAAALATAAGAAAGTASSAAVMHHIDLSAPAEVYDVETTDAAEVEEGASAVRTEEALEPAARTSAHTQAASDAFAADAEFIDTEDVEIEAADDDMSIHVLGVEAVDNGMGGMAIVATLESEGDTALVADIDGDGVMDVLIYDVNGDGVISEDEVHDIREANLYTEDVIGAYEMGNLAEQSAADGPDYMNDADAAFYDA